MRPQKRNAARRDKVWDCVGWALANRKTMLRWHGGLKPTLRFKSLPSGVNPALAPSGMDTGFLRARLRRGLAWCEPDFHAQAVFAVVGIVQAELSAVFVAEAFHDGEA